MLLPPDRHESWLNGIINQIAVIVLSVQATLVTLQPIINAPFSLPKGEQL
jgi:hypothetical protein